MTSNTFSGVVSATFFSNLLLPHSFSYCSCTAILYCMYSDPLKFASAQFDTQERTSSTPLFSVGAVCCSRACWLSVATFVFLSNSLQMFTERCELKSASVSRSLYAFLRTIQKTFLCGRVCLLCANYTHFSKCHFSNGYLFIPHQMHYRQIHELIYHWIICFSSSRSLASAGYQGYHHDCIFVSLFLCVLLLNIHTLCTPAS